MPDTFAQLIPDARRFLSGLAANNTRDWWTENKPTYDSQLKAPALLLLDVLADDLRKATGHSIRTKLFRPHRDVRFSKDKTPYHTHLHMMWSLDAGTSQNPAYFLGIAPDYLRIGAGLFTLDKEPLVRWRSHAAGAGEICTIASGLITKGYELDPPQLKRVPQPYELTHPQADWLRRKGLTLWRSLPEDTEDLRDTLRHDFKALSALNLALLEIA